MPNATHSAKSDSDEESKLIGFYNDLLNGEATPSTEYQKKYLLQLINAKISRIEPKVTRLKKIHYILGISTMILSAASTVILGYKFGGSNDQLPNAFSNAALIITATVTFLSSVAVFWDIENYWIRNKILLNKLKELRYEYVFFLAGSREVQTIDMKRYLESFLSNLGDEYWEKFLKDVRPKNGSFPQGDLPANA